MDKQDDNKSYSNKTVVQEHKIDNNNESKSDDVLSDGQKN